MFLFAFRRDHVRDATRPTPRSSTSTRSFYSPSGEITFATTVNPDENAGVGVSIRLQARSRSRLITELAVASGGPSFLFAFRRDHTFATITDQGGCKAHMGFLFAFQARSRSRPRSPTTSSGMGAYRFYSPSGEITFATGTISELSERFDCFYSPSGEITFATRGRLVHD
ncbi:MAG: hypothetical protein R2734_18310 [Nocardioides sp.]